MERHGKTKNESGGEGRKERKQKEKKCVNLCWQPGSPQKKRLFLTLSFTLLSTPPSSISLIRSGISPAPCFRPVALLVCALIHSCQHVLVYSGACLYVFACLYFHNVLCMCVFFACVY